ncbi:hypothetical protein SAMN03080594_10318 [Arenibacter palladensis]|uniref:Uncharacterized protein n=1 Tax=Arenibacter palladensis TaxID=237373 RepID=A0A1M4ZYN8_9FLAO|nr:hypothetical protein SAMN03080594_10318 [Arenibacter palladensis]
MLDLQDLMSTKIHVANSNQKLDKYMGKKVILDSQIFIIQL